MKAMAVIMKARPYTISLLFHCLVEDGHQEKRNIEGFDSATRDQDTAEMQPFYPPAEGNDEFFFSIS